MWLSLGLKLLGIREWLSNFWKTNWKWLLPVVLFLATLGLGYWKYTSDIDNAFNNGVTKGTTDTNNSWNARIEEENKRNKEFELLLRGIVTEFGEKAVKEAAARIGKETVYRDRISTIVKNNPVYDQCVIDKDVIDSRNSIRALGPQIQF